MLIPYLSRPKLSRYLEMTSDARIVARDTSACFMCEGEVLIMSRLSVDWAPSTEEQSKWDTLKGSSQVKRQRRSRSSITRLDEPNPFWMFSGCVCTRRCTVDRLGTGAESPPLPVLPAAGRTRFRSDLSSPSSRTSHAFSTPTSPSVCSYPW